MGTSHDVVQPASHSRRTLIQHASVGLFGGCALWVVFDSWRSLPGASAGALLYAIVAGVLSWILWFGTFAGEQRRLYAALAMSVLYAGLGWNAGLSGKESGLSVHHLAASAVMGFMLIALTAGYEPTLRRLDYEKLFTAAWRNALVVPLSAALSGLLWVLLWAGAWLMSSIGLPDLAKLLQRSATIALVTGASFGVASGLVLLRAGTLVTLRRFLLSLLTCFLPLALVFAIVWLVALATTGVEPLFATRSAAFYLLWFVLLAVFFLNAAYQSGAESPPYPARLADTLRIAWLAIPVLGALACWALSLRVRQHGWTDERIWAAVAAATLTAHAVLYATSSVRSRGARWMASVSSANVAIAVVQVLVLSALLSPLLDARRLGVQAQVARLASGKVSAEKFDWHYLVRDRKYGRPALAALAAYKGEDARLSDAARMAADTLATADTVRPRRADKPGQALVAATVLPRGTELSPDVQQWLTSQVDWEVAACLTSPANCIIWARDLDGDGAVDIGVIHGQAGHVTLTVFSRGPQGWKRQVGASRDGRSIREWREAIESGNVLTAPPRWPDLAVDGERVELQRR